MFDKAKVKILKSKKFSHYSSAKKSNKAYPASPEIIIIEPKINTHISQNGYGSFNITPFEIFVAAIIAGETNGKNKIGNNISLRFDLIAIPETKLATAIIARLANKVVIIAINIFGGKSIIKNLKNGKMINISIIVR